MMCILIYKIDVPVVPEVSKTGENDQLVLAQKINSVDKELCVQEYTTKTI